MIYIDDVKDEDCDYDICMYDCYIKYMHTQAYS